MDTIEIGIIFFAILVLARARGNSTEISSFTLADTTGVVGTSIYDGTKISIHKHPYMVIIEVDKAHYCTGAIVSDSWVLTTADCVQGKRKNMKVLMRRRYNKVREVSSVTLHPDYPSGVYDYDFACVQIKGKFHFSKGVQPVKIPSQNPSTGSDMMVVGWSKMPPRSISLRSKTSAELVEGRMTWLSDVRCNSTLSQMGIMYTDRKACAYHRNKTTLCTGAWGVPVVKDGVLYGQFVGVEAEGFCSSAASPVILSDISSVNDWVHNVTGAVVDERVVL